MAICSRCAFQAMTMLASSVRAPEIAPSSSIRTPVLGGDHAVVDGALEAVDCLALVEEVEDLDPELRAGRPSEEGPGEAGQVVDFGDDFGKLSIADGERQRLSSGIDLCISFGAPACAAAAAARRPQR